MESPCYLHYHYFKRKQKVCNGNGKENFWGMSRADLLLVSFTRLTEPPVRIFLPLIFFYAIPSFCDRWWEEGYNLLDDFVKQTIIPKTQRVSRDSSALANLRGHRGRELPSPSRPNFLHLHAAFQKKMAKSSVGTPNLWLARNPRSAMPNSHARRPRIATYR